MSTSNPWLNPLQRSYNSIKATLISKLKAKIPEITDYSEGNILVIILSVFSAIAEVLHYYIDNTAQESFFITARRYSSLYKHAKLVDYHIKSGIPATVDLMLYREGNKMLTTDIVIPVNTVFKSSDGKQWLTTKTISWPKNSYSIKVPVEQKNIISTNLIDFGMVTDSNIQIELGKLPTNQKYVEGSMVLTIGNDTWNIVETFAYSNSNSKVFKVEVDEVNEPIIIFGNGKYGMKPPIGSNVYGRYYVTFGSLGNIGPNTFNTVPQDLLNIQNDLKVTNIVSASGGSDYENFNMLKDHIPLSIKTLGVAITKDDYESITKLIPGVSKAYVNYICGRYVEIYITPDNGGEASQALLDSVEATLSKSKVLTTSLTIKSTKEQQIQLELDIHSKRSFNKNDVSDQVLAALLNNYSNQASDINKIIRLSDIYALVDNLSMVDYLKVKNLYFIPIPIPTTSTQSNLVITNYTQEYFKTGVLKETLKIKIISATQYQIHTNTGLIITGTYGQALTVTSINCKFSITIGNDNVSYNIGDTYELNLQPMNDDLTPLNYAIPILTLPNIKLNIYESV